MHVRNKEKLREMINSHLVLKRISVLTHEKVFAFLKRCITTLLNPFWAARESFLISQLFWDSADEQKNQRINISLFYLHLMYQLIFSLIKPTLVLPLSFYFNVTIILSF